MKEKFIDFSWSYQKKKRNFATEMVALPSKRGGVKANGECSVRVNPVKGVCVMKVTAVDGNVVTFKTIF